MTRPLIRKPLPSQRSLTRVRQSRRIRTRSISSQAARPPRPEVRDVPMRTFCRRGGVVRLLRPRPQPMCGRPRARAPIPTARSPARQHGRIRPFTRNDSRNHLNRARHSPHGRAYRGDDGAKWRVAAWKRLGNGDGDISIEASVTTGNGSTHALAPLAGRKPALAVAQGVKALFRRSAKHEANPKVSEIANTAMRLKAACGGCGERCWAADPKVREVIPPQRILVVVARRTRCATTRRKPRNGKSPERTLELARPRPVTGLRLGRSAGGNLPMILMIHGRRRARLR